MSFHLYIVMEGTRTGIKLNYNKCIVNPKCHSLFGNTYTPEGMKSNPSEEDTISRWNTHSLNNNYNHFEEW